MSLKFTQTTSIKKAVEVLNDLSSSKFPLLLSRILQKLHDKEEHAFSEEECKKLEGALDIPETQLQLIIETCEFFLHQAAFHMAKPALLHEQLSQLGLVDNKVEAIVTAWKTNAADVVDKLRHRTLPPKQLEAVNWRLNLQMASSDQSRTKSPSASLELVVRDEADETKEKIRMEFNHAELYKFYNQLETIQSQLDALS